MASLTVTSSICILLYTVAAQDRPSDEHRTQPLYRVTIVSRTTKALNYGYLTAPTRIYFKGTPLLTGSKGDATIEPRRGTTLINARFKEVPPPTRFGVQYLTYVVWAISPEGRAQNLGELMLDASNKGALKTSTPMQTFALIVTAEPYYSVAQPSDVVVMENVVGPDTVGKVEEVNATFELLPRKDFTYEPGSQTTISGEQVSRDRYDSIVAIYQAQSAMQNAEAQGAAQFAPEKLTRARQLLEQARQYPSSQHKEIVSLAREATQIAEDSRAIAVKRAAEERASVEADRAVAAQAPPPPASPPPSAPVEAPAPVTPPPAAETPTTTTEPPVVVKPLQLRSTYTSASENRRKLLGSLKGPFVVTDTPRGVVVTIDGSMAASDSLMYQLRPVADAIRAVPGIHVEVDAHSSGPEAARTEREAKMVRQALIADAVAPDIVVARGFGNSRPRESNASAQGRTRNERVEIVMAGDAIGAVPLWDRTYSIR